MSEYLHKKMTLVDVTDEVAKKIEIRRRKEGGFQRPLRRSRLADMSKALCNGAICPPLMVAIINDRYILIDGQHRFEAWKIKAFPLKAALTKMESMAEATEAFIVLNREQTKVGLEHILGVSASDYAVKVRRMATDCNVSIPHIHNLMLGILHTKNPLKVEVEEKHWQLAAKIMAFWMKNKRWKHEGGVWNSCGVLKLAGDCLRDAQAPDSTLRDLANIDYAKNSPMGRACGTSWASHSRMKDIVYKSIAKQIM